VAIANTRGFWFLKWALHAIVTGVSVIALANLAIVLPVHGTTINTSKFNLGPTGSAPTIVVINSLPVYFY